MKDFLGQFKELIRSDKYKNFLLNVADFSDIDPAFLEKDHWVSLILHYLFELDEEKNLFAFKGGTSLSKVFNLINRFSEDIDIYFSKEKFGYTDDFIIKNITRSQFDTFKGTLENALSTHISTHIGPRLNTFLENNFSDSEAYLEREGNNLYIVYTPLFYNNYISPEVKIELGCIGQLEPTQDGYIQPLVVNFSNIFLNKTRVNVLNPLRTLFEKTMAIHTKTSKTSTNADRFSRHLYDIYMLLSNKQIKHQVFNNLDLFLKSVLFNQKIDGINTTNLTSLLNGDLKLTSDFGSANFKLFEEDYKSMRPMIYGQIPRFDIILSVLKEYEEDLNGLIRKNKPKIKEMFPTIKIL